MKQEQYFTKEELFWIERTADIESAMAILRFTNLIKTDLTKLDNNERDMVKKIGSELIDLYTFLKGLRIKCERIRKDE